MTELAAAPAGAARKRAASSGIAHRLLRSPLTVVGTTLASFLVVLALLTAHATGGREALTASPSSALVVQRGGKLLRTTASGRVLGPAPTSAGTPTGTRSAVLRTRTSGAALGGGEDD